MNEAELQAAHNRSFRNRRCIAASTTCGCFYCESTYPAKDVVEFVRDEETALCPKCGIDSVIGDASGIELSAGFLQEMYDRWFYIAIPDSHPRR